MCRQTTIHQSSHKIDAYSVSKVNSIGELFRDFGEQYIQHYNPSLEQIKLIRSIRVCRTPALGGHVYTCKNCQHKVYIYNSCGNSRCMLCQSIKREQWMDKLSSKLLAVPYLHMVFTLPHELNSLCRQNPSTLYSTLMKVAWKTVRDIGKEQGYSAGMTSVLHTFGSDIKYHVHVHALVTFGGLNSSLLWQYPKEKKKLEKYRKICIRYRELFLIELHRLIHTRKLIYQHSFIDLLAILKTKRWVVHSTWPTMNTKIIEMYLARYINRIAISPSRLKYVKETQQVHILYNDYNNQEAGKIAPKQWKALHPLDAIYQILQHCLPLYFQKSRSHGLHHPSNKIKRYIPSSLKKVGTTIRTILEIITQLLKLQKLECEVCQHSAWEKTKILPDKIYLTEILNSNNKSPPINFLHTKSIHASTKMRSIPMPLP